MYEKETSSPMARISITMVVNPKNKPNIQAPRNKPKKMFEVKNIFCIATWAYDTEIEKCQICQFHIMDQCIHCRSANSTEDCVARFGKCDHVFHDHCIVDWILKHGGNCPYDGCDKKFEPQE